MNYLKSIQKLKTMKFGFWIFENKIKISLLIFIMLIFFSSGLNIFYNLLNYNNIEKGLIIKIEVSTGEGMNRRLHYTIKSQNGGVIFKARNDDSDDCNLEINDSVTYINIGLGYCLLTTCKNIKLEDPLQKIDTISYFLFLIIILGFIFIPKFIKRLKAEQNAKITNYLDDLHINDNNHNIDF